jgi:effector-binding domain-containing protein
MAYEIEVKDLAPVDVVGIKLRTTPDAIGSDAPAALGRVYEGLDRAGLTPAGLPRLVYHAMDANSWSIETCVPVAGASAAPEGLELRHFDGGRAASTLHVGPYDELGTAYRELEVWIDDQGLESAGAPFDIYLNDPSKVKDPAKFETEAVWPVR